MKILSLFDGISCGRVALERAGIPVEVYYASEIDKYATQISQKNYPDIIRLGDVCKITKEMVGEVDMIIGGSPCQSFSNAGNRTGFEGKSGLFYEFVRLVNEVKPKYFLLENVKMKQEWQDVISKELGVKPIEINSSLVSGQNRKRLYWTNIPNVKQPEDKGIFIQDIMEQNISGEYYLEDKTNLGYVCSGDFRYDVGFRWRKGNKSPTISTKGGASKSGSILFTDGERIRRATPIECERLQTLPDNYTQGVSSTARYKAIGNGWTVDVIAHIFKNLTNN